MSNSLIKNISVALTTVMLVSGCSEVVRYDDPNKVETVNVNFGSTDLQSIAEAMTRSLLQSRPIADSSKSPVVTLADVRNKTSEYIDTRTITEKIRTQLLRSGQVQFAVSATEMQNQVDELKRQTQSGLYKKEGAAKTGEMVAAKYRIEGTISSIVKQNQKIKDVFYNFNLSLVNNETGLLEWSDEKEIRKTATK